MAKEIERSEFTPIEAKNAELLVTYLAVDLQVYGTFELRDVEHFFPAAEKNFSLPPYGIA